eukprot:9368670-Pyramimonas_sp.AAC.1
MQTRVAHGSPGGGAMKWAMLAPQEVAEHHHARFLRQAHGTGPHETAMGSSHLPTASPRSTM